MLCYFSYHCVCHLNCLFKLSKGTYKLTHKLCSSGFKTQDKQSENDYLKRLLD